MEKIQNGDAGIDPQTSRMLYHLSYIPQDVSTPSNYFCCT